MKLIRGYKIIVALRRFENGKGLFLRTLGWTDNVAIFAVLLKVFGVQMNYWLFVPIAIIGGILFYLVGFLYEKKKVMHLEAEYGNLNNWFTKEVRETIRRIDKNTRRKV